MVFWILLLLFSWFNGDLAREKKSKNAAKVLNLVPYIANSPSIISNREWQELELDRLVDCLDRTTTSFGRWGLVKLLHPIANMQELHERREIIAFLVNNPDKMHIFQQQLECIKQFEESLLSYWDVKDQLKQASKQFYFSLPFLKKSNESSFALNVSIATEVFNSSQVLLKELAFGGISGEYLNWLYGDQEKFSLWRGIKQGFDGPLRQHSFDLFELKYSKEPYSYKHYIKAFGPQGSLGDRYELFLKGYINDLAGLLSFSQDIPGVGKVGAFLMAAVPTLFYDYRFVFSIMVIGRRLMKMNRLLNELQARVSDVACCFDSIIKLRKLIVNEGLGLAPYFSRDNYDDVSQNIVTCLLTQRFLPKKKYFYSRGHVLTMHLAIKQAKKSLIPLLHSVAFIDAYCSIAKLYQESQKNSVAFNFLEIRESHQPFLHYEQAWLPLLSSQQVIVNDLMLGGDNDPGKIIITGPNGGGKSTVLKTYGVLAILSQGWCITPAKKGCQSLFTSIKTGLCPKENLSKGLSTFMAEKKAMTEIFNDMLDLENHGGTMLALIDEPYKGTVDTESAKRIYQFGKDVAGFSRALIAIATHTEKPIDLEIDTNAIFGNYQVKIEEISPYNFERLFKLEKGPALWWFTDESKRSRFIDWIDVGSILS